MNKRPLIETNPHHKGAEKYWKALIINVSSSTAIETGAPIESIARTLTKSKDIKKPKDSAR